MGHESRAPEPAQGESSNAGTPDTTRQNTLGEFLVAMRARLTPEDVGLRTSTTGRRRTPGLRRQEVAELAAVSIDWYIRLEQGRVGAPGTGVLDAIGEALRLNSAEREYLHLTARGETPPRPLPGSRAEVTASLRAVLDGMPLLPAYVVDHCFDVLAHNAAAAAMFGEDFGAGPAANTALLLFLEPQCRRTQLSWEQIARETVGALRANFARYPDDPRLHSVVATLRARSPEFAGWWEDHTVDERTRGVKLVLHPTAGLLTVAYDMLAAGGDTGQRIMVLTPVDAPTEQRLRALVGAAHHAASIRQRIQLPVRHGHHQPVGHQTR
ncbi:MAG: helix-turn-helix domain-containing protein [Streptomyces sp.]|nr:helix-turn-helix domain-containing protein [Streptomyces sp.]